MITNAGWCTAAWLRKPATSINTRSSSPTSMPTALPASAIGTASSASRAASSKDSSRSPQDSTVAAMPAAAHPASAACRCVFARDVDVDRIARSMRRAAAGPAKSSPLAMDATAAPRALVARVDAETASAAARSAAIVARSMTSTSARSSGGATVADSSGSVARASAASRAVAARWATSQAKPERRKTSSSVWSVITSAGFTHPFYGSPVAGTGGVATAGGRTPRPPAPHSRLPTCAPRRCG